MSQPLTIQIPAYTFTYAISASPETLDFGSEAEGYAAAPAAQIVTIKNTGNQSVTVNLPTSTNYIITAGEGFTNDTATLAPNGTAAFTVQPNTGLDVGSHDDTLNISGSDGTSASVELSFTVAFATGSDKAIMLGTEHLQGGQEDNIYFGNYAQTDSTGNTKEPVKWRVLDDQTNTGENGLFLLSEELLGTGNYGGVYFQQSYHYDSSSGSYHKGSAPANGDHTDCLIANAWQGSDAQTWCATFYSSNFSTGEQGAVIATTKSDAAFISSTHSFSFAASENILNGDKVFFLSAQEAENSEYGFTNDAARIANYGGSAGVWWLRSPYVGSTNGAGMVHSNGYVDNNLVNFIWAARPAFNLNLNSVLFTSAAEGGKSTAAASGGNQGGEAADAIFKIDDYDGSEWKLTLLDSSRQFSVTEETASGKPGDTITLNYTGATVYNADTAPNEYISVIIADDSGAQYYGRITQPTSAEGQVEITIPTSLVDGTYTLNVFSEQYNGGANDDTKLTDYASAFETVSLTVSNDTTAPTLSNGSATRTGENEAMVKFTSDEAGSYYYEVVESGTAAPTIGTTGTGTACDTTEQTISLNNLSGAGAKDIYIVAKDAAGNVSEKLKIEIPVYVAPSYGIFATPSALNFESKTEGYEAAPEAQTVTIQNTGNQTITLNQPAATDFNIGTLSTTDLAAGGTATFTVQPKTGLGAGDYSETLTISGSNSTSASVKLSFTVNAVYTLTVNLNGGSGNTTSGQYPAGEEVNIDAGSRSNYRFAGWTSSNGDTFADASSASTTFTMPAADTTITANWEYNGGGGGSSRPSTPSTPTGPATGESSGWKEIGDEIGEAQPGETIVVDMNGTTEVPAEIFEEVAGKDVTVEFDLGGGISWTVNGQDVPTGASFQSLNLGVDMGTSGISANVINNITGEYGSVQITLAHDGEFGFALTLTAPLGSDNAGHWANLYYYHEDSEALTFQTSGRIGADGSVSLRFSHASQYAIVIDDYSHEMPFEDVGEGVWYYDAVSYVYAKGLMGGTSATTFEPNTTTSRAMIAVILWRQAGSPIAEEYTDFSDVAEGAWYTQAVRWASNAGVVGGYPNGSFGPNDPITREQMAAMLYRYAQYQGMEMATLEENLAGFADADKISGYAVQAMNWAVGQGIMGGYGDGTLGPQGNATRAQAAAMLQRFCEAYIDSEE